MTTARDVIASVLVRWMSADEAKLFAEDCVTALLSAPESGRQELAALLMSDNDNKIPVPPQFAALGISEGQSVVISRSQHEALMRFTRVKDNIDCMLNDVLCEMKPNFDDSITGFNEAWDVMRKIFERELAALRAAGILETTNA